MGQIGASPVSKAVAIIPEFTSCYSLSMAELEPPVEKTPEPATPPGARSKDDIALELMKFIAVTVGYGKSPQNSAGFSGKPASPDGR